MIEKRLHRPTRQSYWPDPPAVENPFVPLRLLPDAAAIKEGQLLAEESPDEIPTQKQCIDILVPGGAIIRVGEHCNLKLVAKLLSALRGQEQC